LPELLQAIPLCIASEAFVCELCELGKSQALELAMDETLHCETSKEVAAIAQALHTELIATYLRYLAQTNPLADAPSWR
jgi:hypothetical protein